MHVCTSVTCRRRAASHFTWNTPTPEDLQVHDPAAVFAAGMRHHHIANTAYPISHKSTIKPYRVPRLVEQKEMRHVLAGAYGDLQEMMLYVHVPFCQTRCQFCEYTVVDPAVGKRDDAQTAYFDALEKEFVVCARCFLGGFRDDFSASSLT
jgi:oxygen-independent coproporphyrinogen-3 oxidase